MNAASDVIYVRRGRQFFTRVLAASYCLWTLWALPHTTAADEFPTVVNSQDPKDVPPTALEAAEKIAVPDGFKVTLFAGEPDVRQPIAFEIDDRGRVWVVECYTYAEQGYEYSMSDRVVILDDTDGDGQFDERKIFFDQGQLLTGITFGFGGVWLLNGGRLEFYPDENRDDIPDGPPTVLLDGFDIKHSQHNIVNGLLWGPDGWLYGRQGIMATSRPGRLETPPYDREPFNCGIWRFHPTRHTFEIVCHGTTNPWGMDYNDFGEMFFTNNVIGHLWHVIPGAHYKRMHGEDFNPHLYELIDQHADHYHWDTGQNWTDSRDAVGPHGELGGGHSHCGGMIYLGDNWPKYYRNTIFMCNTHGRRVNHNLLKRKGSGYVGKRSPDFLFANQPWFRGVSLKYGPDGGVYLSDWTDIGECHDNDGVHRTSGRIYKIVYKAPNKVPPGLDIAAAENSALVELQSHRNDWYVRHARRALQERAAAGENMTDVHADLLRLFDRADSLPIKLRAIWALSATGAANPEWLLSLLDDPQEEIRLWAIRLLVDQPDTVTAGTIDRLSQMATLDNSALVRLGIASAMQKIPLDRRWAIANALCEKSEDANDHNLPLMIWYGIEPAVAADPGRATALAQSTKMPLIREYVSRRIGSELRKAPDAVAGLITLLSEVGSPDEQRQILRGITAALRGWSKADPPQAWSNIQEQLSQSPDGQVRELTRELAVVFGDGRALDELREIAADRKRPATTRQDALRVLIDNQPDGLVPLLRDLVKDRSMNTLAVEGLASYNDSKTPELLISQYTRMRDPGRQAAIATLVSRAPYAVELLAAIGANKINRSEISAFHVRQMLNLNDNDVTEALKTHWGVTRPTPADKARIAERIRELLTQQSSHSADLSAGRLVFNKVCSNCHRLYGVGTTIGPDLTGSNRDNLDYLLGNIVDPSATVANEFRMSVIALTNGRVINGVVVRETNETIEVQTEKERLVIDRNDIDDRNISENSLMPDGILDKLSKNEIRNLFAYLAGRRQVPLPETVQESTQD